jgi:hypothetical protein
MRTLLALLAAVLVGAPLQALAGIVFTDGEFTNWSFGSHGNSSVGVGRQVSGGNPGARVAISTSTFTGATGYGFGVKDDYSTTAALDGTGFTLTLDVLAGTGVIGDGQGIQLVVEQGGSIYATNLGITGVRASFTTLSFNGTLNPGSFQRVQGSGPLQPSFTGGVATRFGFAAGNTLSPAMEQYYDNVRLNLAALAGECAGFSDVLDNEIYCLSAQWLRNRGITLGCTATQYCPTNNVTRAQMALFMNRLGSALATDVRHRQAQLANVTLAAAAPGTLLCETANYTTLAFPRTARFTGTLAAQPTGAPATLQAYWRYTTDSGATWNYVGDWLVDQFPTIATAAAGQVATATVLAPPLDLATATTYRFGLFADGAGATPAFGTIICQIEVRVASNSATP